MKFSIITPSFGQLDWLRLCVASIADQPLSSLGFDVEHIIQDGGSLGIEEFAREMGTILNEQYGGDWLSNLQTFELLNFRTSSGYRLRIFREPDAGMYDAINKGLARATGEICAWLNSDEQYLEGTLAKVAKFFLQNNPPDVLLGDALLTDGEHRPVCYRRIMVPSRWHTRLDHLHSLSCAMFFRKSALPSPPLDPRWKVISDAVLMDYFLHSKKKIVACGQLLAAYSFTGKNLSANPTNREHAVWMQEMKWPPLWLRAFVVMNNRIRRLAHGAYAFFIIHEGLFTRESPALRKHIHGSVSGKWPKETGFRDPL